jgi:hypothetical protein
MKHTDWLRLKSEGDSICLILRQQGYQCQKQTRRLSWKLSKEGRDDYVLTWLPAPIGDWSLIPNNNSPARTQLWQLIEHTLTRIKGKWAQPRLNPIHKLKITLVLGRLSDSYPMPDDTQ